VDSSAAVIVGGRPSICRALNNVVALLQGNDTAHTNIDWGEAMHVTSETHPRGNAPSC
jgi:hypothetical protein